MSTNLHDARVAHEAAASSASDTHNGLSELGAAREEAYFRARDQELIAAMRSKAASLCCKDGQKTDGCCGKSCKPDKGCCKRPDKEAAPRS